MAPIFGLFRTLSNINCGALADTVNGYRLVTLLVKKLDHRLLTLLNRPRNGYDTVGNIKVAFIGSFNPNF